jgi:hypothetical protein
MKKSLFVLPALLMACGFEPEAGTYTIEIAVIDDGCGMMGERNTDTGYADTGATDEAALTWGLTLAEDGSTVTLDEMFVCERDGKSFKCDDTAVWWDANEDMMMDAVVSIAQTIDAKWASATTIEGDLTMGFSCIGAECDSAAVLFEESGSAIPCTSTGTFTAALGEDSADEEASE